MENDGPETKIRSDGSGLDNVVHFTGDWYGPREELIPFGPSATEEPEAAGVDPAPEVPASIADARQVPASVAEVPGIYALGADAFWGEDSGRLHEPIQAPGAVRVDPARADRPSAPGSAPLGPPVRRRVRAGAIFRWRLPVRLHAPAHPRGALAAVGLLIAVLAVSVAGFGSGPGHGAAAFSRASFEAAATEAGAGGSTVNAPIVKPGIGVRFIAERGTGRRASAGRSGSARARGTRAHAGPGSQAPAAPAASTATATATYTPTENSPVDSPPRGTSGSTLKSGAPPCYPGQLGCQ